MARYIDADKLKKNISSFVGMFTDELGFAVSIEAVLNAIDFAIETDSVEVVRCKDCKHRVKPSKMCAHPKAIGWDAIEPEDDDFCSYGERKEK